MEDERLISIHLMFLLIYHLISDSHSCLLHFNTSHVSINLLKGFNLSVNQAFQYISCFY